MKTTKEDCSKKGKRSMRVKAIERVKIIAKPWPKLVNDILSLGDVCDQIVILPIQLPL